MFFPNGSERRHQKYKSHVETKKFRKCFSDILDRKRKVQFPNFQFCTKDKNVNLIQETQTKAQLVLKPLISSMNQKMHFVTIAEYLNFSAINIFIFNA